MRQLLLALFMSVAVSVATAQSYEAAVEPDEHYPGQNYIGRLEVIRTDHTSQYSGMHDTITLEVIVTAQGRVEYAHAVHGPAELLSQAEALEMERRFKPFHKDGKPVKAVITDYVSILPTERWGTKQPFPDVKDWDSLRFRLERPRGYCEDCPAYSVEVRGDGAVAFSGENAAIPGKYLGKISRQQVAGLLETFRQADCFSLKDRYVFEATDLEDIKTSLTVDGKTKKVTDYAGLEVGMPGAVTTLEIAMDKAAVAAFRAEGLNEQAKKLEAAIASRH